MRYWNALRRHRGSFTPTQFWWLSPLLVGITTGVVFWIQRYLIEAARLPHIRPFGIALLIPVMILTAWGGRMVGLLTLVLAALSCTFVLEQPHFSWEIQNARAGVELLFLVLVGLVAVFTVEARRQHTDFLEDISRTPRAAAMREEIRQIADQVNGVSGLGDCMIYQRGLDIYLHLDIRVDDADSVKQARAVAANVKQALAAKLPLLLEAHVHLA